MDKMLKIPDEWNIGQILPPTSCYVRAGAEGQTVFY